MQTMVVGNVVVFTVIATMLCGAAWAAEIGSPKPGFWFSRQRISRTQVAGDRAVIAKFLKIDPRLTWT